MSTSGRIAAASWKALADEQASSGQAISACCREFGISKSGLPEAWATPAVPGEFSSVAR